MDLIDLTERATIAGGVVTIPLATRPKGERIDLQVPVDIVAYYRDGETTLAAAEDLRDFLVSTAQTLLANGAIEVQQSQRAGLPPTVLLNHEALELS